MVATITASSGAPLSGLAGMYPDPWDTTDTMDEGVLESKSIGTLDPDHSEYGSQSVGYSGQVPTQSPYSDFSIYDAGGTGDYTSIDFPVEGGEIDQTPATHSADYPRGIIQPNWNDPDAWATVGQQINDVHATDLGGPRMYNQNQPGGHEQPVTWTADDYVAPNQSMLAAPPGQLRGANGYGEGLGNSSGAGGSNADPDQGYGVVNTMQEFNAGHSIRNVQHDKLGFDYTNLHGEQQVPFWGRHPVQQSEFDGPDSPYYEMGSIDGANIPWEGRIGYPTPYTQAPEPTIVAAQPTEDVWAYG
jgi:hypothetical protein